MIQSFEIDNFKSLVNFKLPSGRDGLPRFVCLIGLNGAGKSALLQALDFTGNLVSGKVDDWLNQRGWGNADLKSRFTKKQLIEFRVVFRFDSLGDVEWECSYNAVQKRCTSETIRCSKTEVLKVAENELLAHSRDGERTRQPIQNLSYKGSVLSLLKVNGLHPALGAVKRFAASLKSLDMLAPNSMRKGSRKSNDVGYGGERLAGFLHGFSKEQKTQMLELLKQFYPHLESWETKGLRAGWKALQIGEDYPDANRKPVALNIRQINDGMLRIMAILAQTRFAAPGQNGENAGETNCRCLLFDEIENGINPELMEKLVSHLLETDQQIFVTTHSPMILNFLPDDVARDSVFILYRNAEGHTQAMRFFDLPSTRKKLQLLGPGEVFADTDLNLVTREAETTTQG